ncbi:AAA domain-containing protein [Sphingobium fuliginis]|uniref:Protein kinase domain-containing protein n=1 Tax=Sphingobium fuliginis ATCC 27551 TaxID=1208342 RepID=A0A5B8CC78_SPHSA|nr:AAA domain-containing protein [Sphingobium fuliginis]QDC36395.1 hypothetical protein FIL70_03180 [Sphingobium fuliginis ATCC 27551]
MAKIRSRTPDSPLKNYSFNDHFWQKSDVKSGRPGIIGAAHVVTGVPVIVKEWPRRQGLDDSELEEIWRHEVRQLHRLVSYPGARESLAVLLDSSEEKDAFYLVLSCENRVPLQTLLEGNRGQYWFRAPRTPRNRLRLWEEFNRLAEGLEILHAQGILHRNIDAWSVLTSAGQEPDFLLTGFEWSIRLSQSVAKTAKSAERGRKAGQGVTTYSFYEDWRTAGVLAARLLNFPSLAKAGEAYRPDVSGAAEFLTAGERDLLSLLLRADPLQRIDGEVVIEKIDQVIDQLKAQVQGSEPKLVLALQISRDSPVSRAIRDASERTINVWDEEDQLRFVHQDLSEDPRLVRMKSDDPDKPPRFELVGRHLTYVLAPYAPPFGEENWSIARCSDVRRQPPPYALIDEDRRLEGWSLEPITLGAANQRYRLLQGKTSRWDRILRPLPADPRMAALADRTYRAMTLVQVLDTLALAAEIWPVRVAETIVRDGDIRIKLVGRDDPLVSRLAKALGLEPPSVRLQKLLESEQPAVDGEWKLSDEGGIGVRDSDKGVWRFVDIDRTSQPAGFVFEGSARPIANELFLRSGGAGHDRLLRRRLKALKSLREHSELLDMLADPQLDRRSSHEKFTIEDVEDRLDDSKTAALKELWAVLPLYMVQGPPGVGKTKLVQELVAARLGADGTERLLLAAQSHSAVDHLLDQVRKTLNENGTVGSDGNILALRCRPRDREQDSDDWDLANQARTVAERLAASSLVADAPEELKTRVSELVGALKKRQSDEDEPPRSGRTDRSFEALLLRSSNLIFASTGSLQLEQLIEERAQFDWSIVEEAGKATGVELLAPMLLSHRRLMIGDHKQLPPFNADAIERLLLAPSKLKEAIEIGRDLIIRPFGQAGMDDALDALLDCDIDALVSDTRSALLLFESMIEAEAAIPRTPASPPSMAHRLKYQHRMHPAISKLVSTAFYEGKLLDDEKVEARFEAKHSPVLSHDVTRLPDSPVLFVDIPFSREQMGGYTPEQLPRWRNRAEAELCCDALELLRPAPDKRPSLAVLSPYRAQMRLLEDRIDQLRPSRLKHLSDFSSPVGGFCGTVDSFQGNEADVVMISLVRHNHHAGVKALGFLSDPRRMNVLISRAKWRLILVGSLRFLRARFQPGEQVGKDHPLRFLQELLRTLDDLTTQKDAQGVPRARIITPQMLKGTGQ